ncbi:MAG: RelA/SpoT domain-containing protein [Parasphingorhabdus sp.]|uniref:RelA/SpoT domain-containing protein n=1 Tax=Parasphingorhabdus sp. TaxID=2709688 RepID=UPI00329727C6
MTFYAQPDYSKTRVDKAGSNVANGNFGDDDVEIVENWRASHAQILNTFKQILYNRARKIDCLVVQRLKRRPTIIDKLSRDPNMTVRLSQMQDIAGCRLIFGQKDDLYSFKGLMDKGSFAHKLAYERDYILEPKEDGYRGLHQIYNYNVEPRKGHASENQPWNGMRVEVQYRTITQHIWATAVETAGLLTANNPKFKKGSQSFVDFFKVCSEMLSRSVDSVTAVLPGLTNVELVDEYRRLNNDTHIVDIFERVNARIEDEKFSKTSILIFNLEKDAQGSEIQVLSYDSMNSGIKDYDRLEKELAGKADLVLVKADAEESMRSAYRNYFADTVEFLHLIKEAESNLPSQDHLELSL